MMMAQVSLYPLAQEDLNPAIEEVWKTFKERGLQYRVTPMSTCVWAEEDRQVFSALEEAFARARAHGSAIMVMTVTSGEKVKALLEYL